MADLELVKNWVLKDVLPCIIESEKIEKRFDKLLESQRESFEVTDVDVKPIGDDAFMLTKCYRIKVVYKVGENEFKCVLFGKLLPQVDDNIRAAFFDRLYHNEILAYTKLFPSLLNVTKSRKLFNFPKHYYSNMTGQVWSIALGDFQQNDFWLCKSRFNLSIEHVLLAVKQIGIFHGAFYAMKVLDWNNFNSMASDLKRLELRAMPPTHYMLLTIGTQRIIMVMEKYCSDICSNFRKNMKVLLDGFEEYMPKRLEAVEPHATICHGDYLRNNVAYSYNDEGVPKDILTFDFQRLGYLSPGIDLSLFLLISCGDDVRKKHFPEIIDLYHRCLASTFVSCTQMEIPSYLTKKELLKEYIRCTPYNAAIAGFFLPILHVPYEKDVQEGLLDPHLDVELMKRNILSRGGEALNLELEAIVRHIYELSVEENVDVFDGFI